MRAWATCWAAVGAPLLAASVDVAATSGAFTSISVPRAKALATAEVWPCGWEAVWAEMAWVRLPAGSDPTTRKRSV